MGQTVYQLNESTSAWAYPPEVQGYFPEVAAKVEAQLPKEKLQDAVSAAHEMFGTEQAPKIKRAKSDRDIPAGALDQKRELSIRDLLIGAGYNEESLNAQRLTHSSPDGDLRALQELMSRLPKSPATADIVKQVLALESVAKLKIEEELQAKLEMERRATQELAAMFGMQRLAEQGHEKEKHKAHPPLAEGHDHKHAEYVYHPGLGDAPYRTPLDNAGPSVSKTEAAVAGNVPEQGVAKEVAKADAPPKAGEEMTLAQVEFFLRQQRKAVLNGRAQGIQITL